MNKVLAEGFDDVLEFEFLENTQTLVIRHGTSRTEFKCLDAMEFPALQSTE